MNTDDDTEGLGGTPAMPADHRTTSRSGVATKSYSRDVTSSDTEEIDAKFVTVVGECEDTVQEPKCNESDDMVIEATAINHYWADAVSAATVTGVILVADTDNNTVVVDSGGPMLVTYKAGDQFTIAGSGATTLEAFEDALSEGDDLTATIGDDADDINIFTLTDNDAG